MNQDLAQYPHSHSGPGSEGVGPSSVGKGFGVGPFQIGRATVGTIAVSRHLGSHPATEKLERHPKREERQPRNREQMTSAGAHLEHSVGSSLLYAASAVFRSPAGGVCDTVTSCSAVPFCRLFPVWLPPQR